MDFFFFFFFFASCALRRCPMMMRALGRQLATAAHTHARALGLAGLFLSPARQVRQPRPEGGGAADLGVHLSSLSGGCDRAAIHSFPLVQTRACAPPRRDELGSDWNQTSSSGRGQDYTTRTATSCPGQRQAAAASQRPQPIQRSSPTAPGAHRQVNFPRDEHHVSKRPSGQPRFRPTAS
jgi:hypothetical protein